MTNLTTKPTTKIRTIGIVAGEISGDGLGAKFMLAMRAICPQVQFVGVGGAKMQALGLSSIIKMERLSVMGLVEVVKHLPDLWSAKTQILHAFEQARIDMFVGIDSPDFNLRLGKVLKPKGVFCVQYVSPSIWAWRENRIHTIKQSTHLVLCLFPFELPVYAKHHHPAVCVGHPLIQTLSPNQKQATTKLLDLAVPKTVFDNQSLCLMAGSRVSEIRMILPLLLESFARLSQSLLGLCAIIPVAKSEHIALIQAQIKAQIPHLKQYIFIVSPSQNEPNPAHLAMQACDLTILASGTATLEALLLNAPMVVVYKVNELTFQLAKRLIKTPYVALPNILSYYQDGGAIVPELIQEQANPSLVKAHAMHTLQDLAVQKQALQTLTKTLKQSISQDPAQVVLEHYQKFKQVVI